MVGDWLVTVTLSCSVATSSLPLIVAVAPAFRLTPSMFRVAKPGNSNDTLYWPPDSSVKRYTPCSFETVVRAPPIMLGLAIDTVTPGKAPPLASVARPVIAPVCCCASAEPASAIASASELNTTLQDFQFIDDSLSSYLTRGKKGTTPEMGSITERYSTDTALKFTGFHPMAVYFGPVGPLIWVG